MITYNYIIPKMLEPATASIAIYLLAKTPLDINRNHKIILRRPYHVKRKVCKWILHNRNELTERFIDETSDYLIDVLNLVKIINFNPSIFVMIYIMLLIIVIVF